MSWKSPGRRGGRRGSPGERPRAGSSQPNSLPEEEGRERRRFQQHRPPSIQTQLPLQQPSTPRDEGEEASIVRGGSPSLRQYSRLTGYTTPQPYHSPQLQPHSSSTGERSRAQSLGERSRAQSWSTSQPQIPLTSLMRGSSDPQDRGRQFSPRPIPYAQAAAHQQETTPYQQIPRSQTLPPSVPTSFSSDADNTQGRASAGQPSRSSVFPQSTRSARTPPISAAAPAEDLKPLPQNLRGDPFRSAKVKTELCRYYKTPKGCIFGDKCNYAHGEQELKFNKLMDLEAAGLIDVEVFRCHVCFTWVATGACPFDQRCTRLHDPRVIGTEPSWLPHAEVLVGSTNKTGREVDKLFHQQYCAIYSCSPIYGFAPKKRWRSDETSTTAAWKEFYYFCCNMEPNQSHSQGGQWRISPTKGGAAASQVEITEMHRLAMILMMRERRKAQCYAYLPSHIFCGELCLVLQTSYFKLEVVESFLDIRRYQVVEISEDEASKISETEEGVPIIIAREIAFGPVADASVRPVSIWFDIQPEDIIPCTRQQARKHKRTRHRLREKRNYDSQPEEVKMTASCSIPPFTCHEPMDEMAFNLITGILTHRYRVLKYFSSGPDERALRSVALEEEKLRKSFESQRRFWMTWTWPKKIGSSVQDGTEVPSVDGTYNFVTYGDPGYGEDSLFFGSDQQDRNTDDSLQVVSKQAKLATGFVWRSFVMNFQLISGQGVVDMPQDNDQMPTHDALLSNIRRIPTLRNLSLGIPAVGNFRRMPGINPQARSTAPIVISLDDLIHEWKVMQRQYEESASSFSLKDIKRGKVTPRIPLTYPFEIATHSWSRIVPSFRRT